FLAHLAASRKGKQARAEYDAAVAEIGQKSRELMELMNQADFHTVANFAGETKKLADELMDNTMEALTLVGGANKFLAETEALIQGRGVAGKLANFFTSANYNRALGLLTDENAKLEFSAHDATRAVMQEGSAASTWRDQLLKAGSSRVYTSSLKEVLLAMAERRDRAVHLLDEIDTKGSEINTFLSDVQARAGQVQQQARQLVSAGQSDHLFTAEAVATNLLPAVLSEKDGLVARGMALKDTDPVRAWNEYGEQAKRMYTEGSAIVALGTDARQSLLPTLQKADESLHTNGVKTDWAHQQKEALSKRLDATANTAVRTSVAGELEKIQQDLDALEARVNTVVSQDKQRREVAPKQIGDAEADVDSARQQIHGQLQKLGAFKAGKPDQVLREPQRDPSVQTGEAHRNLQAVKSDLDKGDIEAAGQHLEAVASLSQDAHRLVKETKEALAAYPATLQDRKSRHQAIADSVGKKYPAVLDGIRKTYAPEVLKLVAPDVGAAETLADNVEQARAQLDAAAKSTAAAEANLDKAQVLATRDGLNQADGQLKAAQAQLDSITAAEKLLSEKQAAAEQEVRALEGRLKQTQGKANATYVRGSAQELFKQASQKLQEASAYVVRQPRNPYDAQKFLAVAENVRAQCEQAVEADRQAFEAAKSGISGGESAIASAAGTINGAERQSWSESISDFGNVSESVSSGELNGARQLLQNAQSELGKAQRLLASQD
ncbi:MAG: hypothetical protein AB1758_32625, partial [Candidatus Eremiobacterota bacterium]